jgi:hypothetical protein
MKNENRALARKRDTPQQQARNAVGSDAAIAGDWIGKVEQTTWPGFH